MPRSTRIREIAARLIAETGTHADVARALKREFGWGCTDATASARLSQMLSPRNRKYLAAEALEIIIAITDRDPFTELLAEARVMAKVERRQADRRRALG